MNYIYSNLQRDSYHKCQDIARIKVPLLMEDKDSLDWLFYKAPLYKGKHLPELVSGNLARLMARKVPLTLYVEIYGTRRIEIIRSTAGPSGIVDAPALEHLQTYIHNRILDLFPKLGLQYADRRVTLKGASATEMDID